MFIKPEMFIKIQESFSLIDVYNFAHRFFFVIIIIIGPLISFLINHKVNIDWTTLDLY